MARGNGGAVRAPNVTHMKGTMRLIRNMATASSIGPAETSTRENIKRMKEMGMEK
jgi:hypothetical protein